MDTLKQIEKIAEKIEPKSSIRSITSQASKSIYYFPVVCSKTVPVKTATLIASNLEIAYMSFVKACFALTPAVAVKGDKVNVEEYLKMFHQNVGIKSANELFLTLKESIEEWELFPNETLNEVTSDRVRDVFGRVNSNHNVKENFGNAYVEDIESTPKAKSVKAVYDNKSVEKANGLRPSVIGVDVTFILKGKEVSTTIPVGVKTVIHPVDPDELSEQIMDSVAGRGIFHNIIRYKTGEILSLSDILFGISKMKKNISKSRNSDVSKWMDIIDHRKRLSKLSKPFLGKKAFLPNLTVNISMDDVDTINRLIGYNLLTDTHRAAKFIKDTFLLALVITDDATETAYIMYDGHSSYEEYPYSSLRRENDKRDSEVENLIKGLNIGSRI